MAKLTKLTITRQKQFRSMQAARWPQGRRKGNENIGHPVNGRTTRAQEIITLKTALTETRNELQLTKQAVQRRTQQAERRKSMLHDRELAYHQTKNILGDTLNELGAARAELEETRDLLEATRMASKHWHSLLRHERRKVSRREQKARRVKHLEKVLIPSLTNAAKTRSNELENRIHALEECSLGNNEVVVDLRKALRSSRTQTKKHQMRALRATRALANVVEKARHRPYRLSSITRRALHSKNGAYSPELRTIARSLVLAGCAREEVGHLLKSIGTVFGIRVPKAMSRRTVSRAVLEGGIASQVQVAHEMATTDAITISSDGTSHRHIDFISRHVALKAPGSGSGAEGQPGDHVIRLLGVDSSVNHTAETQVAGWKEKFESFTQLYNESPFSQRNQHTLSALDVTDRIKGVNGDHSADQVKTFEGIRAWKMENVHARLVMETAGLAQHTLPETQSPPDSTAMEIFDSLSPSEQRRHTLLVRGGCCMHKELNAVKGGYAEMAGCWEAKGLERPVLLANRDNAATLKEVSTSNGDGEGLTAAEIRALEMSGGGGVKAAAIAGAIFNNKDDKKGYHDVHRHYFEQIKGRNRTVTFPDTSNTRYQSYCDAAEELLAYQDDYIRLLNQIRYKKEKRNFSHMEENLFKALHDGPTLTELAVLVWYAAAISHPYMYYVRGSREEGTGLLNLGPLHAQLKHHIQNIINNPLLLLADDSFPPTATLDGSTEWHNPIAVHAVQQLARHGHLPHLSLALTAFFKGSLTVWERFTSEFAPDSTVSTMTDVERDSAWMPPTNDINEGALGSYRVRLRQKPVLTLHQYNAEALYRHNGTETFISSSCTQEDHQWLMRKAREIDSAGLEGKRRAELATHSEQVARERQAKESERAAAVAKENARIDAISLITDAALLQNLTKAQLDDQLAIHRRHDPTIKAKSCYKSKQDKLAAVRAALYNLIGEVVASSQSTSNGDSTPSAAP